MNPAFWAGKRVFLTGHTGFKGGWMSLWLHQLGAKVHGFALAPPTDPNLFTVAGVADVLEHEIGDIRDPAALARSVEAFAPDIVIHMAAQPIVRDSYRIPVETYQTNVMGTVHVLEAVRQTPSIKATVVITSDKCYENREQIWPYRETDAMGGYDPYSSSKGCTELVVAAYGRSYFAPEMGRGSLATVRAGNVVGGGDWANDRLVPDLIRGLSVGEDIIIRRPHSVRPWQHVLEPLSGYLRVAENLWEGGPLSWEGWNFGPDAQSNQTVGVLAREICKVWGRPDALKIVEDPNAPHEAGLLKLDSTKATTYLGWRPRWNFEACIANTVDWYRAYYSGKDIAQFTRDQIAAYASSSELI